MKKIVFAAVFMGVAVSANAAGFRIAEQDARANGMGNAAVAAVNNPSAVWYNPAVLTDLEGTNLSLGTVLIIPDMEHQNTNGTTDRIKDEVHIPPHFYATRKLNNKWSLGFGVNAPFGLSTEWKDTARTAAVATLSDIQVINYKLSGAYKVSEKISVTAGINYAMLDAKLNNYIGTPLKLEGDGDGIGYNAAVNYKHNDKWNFGLNYNSRIEFDVDGTAKLGTTVSNPATTEITTPDLIQLGAAYKYSDKLLLTAEVDYTAWSTYDTLTIKSNTYLSLPGGSDTNRQIKDWRDVMAFRVGSEHKFSDAWKMRLGAFYDMNPVKDERFETRVPDTDRIGLSVGGGYTRGCITVDASFLYLKFLNRTVSDSWQDSSTTNTLNGEYRSTAILPALTVSYKF